MGERSLKLSLNEQREFDYLSQVSLFEDVRHDPRVLTALRSLMTEKVFSPGSIIIEEGTMGHEMFLLLSGNASVNKSTPSGDHYKVVDLNGSNHVFFGEGALIDNDVRSATIKAETECHCLVLESNVFMQFSLEHPDWALPIFKRIARTVMGRLRKTSNDLLLLYNALVSEIRGH